MYLSRTLCFGIKIMDSKMSSKEVKNLKYINYGRYLEVI